jgi:hypothetical protein
MRTWSFQCADSEYEKLVACREFNADVVIVFAPQKLFKSKDFADFLKNKMADIPMVGCSTSGEIFDAHTSDGTIVAMGLAFDATRVNFARVPLLNAETSFDAGVNLAKALEHPELKAIFTLSLGVNVNGSAFVRGLRETLHGGVVIAGGLAGDGTDFKDTYTMLNGDISNHHAVAFGLIGDRVCVTSGSAGGWEDFGPQRRVTLVKDSVLLELDNKPALPMYMQYIGDKAKDLPSSALFFPFSILDDTGQGSGLIRTILDVNHEEQSIIFAGELPKNGMVCLMHSDTDMLIEGAKQAALTALPDTQAHELIQGDCATIMVSCVGRKLVMGEDLDEEVEAVRRVFKDECKMIGFYSFGEIGVLAGTDDTHFHNQTMTVTHIFERKED